MNIFCVPHGDISDIALNTIEKTLTLQGTYSGFVYISRLLPFNFCFVHYNTIQQLAIGNSDSIG